MKTMKQRADAIETVLERYGGGNLEECLTDIMTDIRHFCDYRDIDFHKALEWSYEHYETEKREA